MLMFREKKLFGSKKIARYFFFTALGIAIFVFVPYLIGGQVFGYDTDWITDFIETIRITNRD